jgi:hypothetical protein
MTLNTDIDEYIIKKKNKKNYNNNTLNGAKHNTYFVFTKYSIYRFYTLQVIYIFIFIIHTMI